MVTSPVVNLDASRIYGDLYVGSLPPLGAAIAHAGYDVLVLAAEEYQPAEWRLPGVDVIYAPMKDVPEILSKAQLREVKMVGVRVANALRAKRKVLVSCVAGLNRSSLLAASALLQSTDMHPLRVIRLIREKRGSLALNNPAFIHAITTQFRRRLKTDS